MGKSNQKPRWIPKPYIPPYVYEPWLVLIIMYPRKSNVEHTQCVKGRKPSGLSTAKQSETQIVNRPSRVAGNCPKHRTRGSSRQTQLCSNSVHIFSFWFCRSRTSGMRHLRRFREPALSMSPTVILTGSLLSRAASRSFPPPEATRYWAFSGSTSSEYMTSSSTRLICCKVLRFAQRCFLSVGPYCSNSNSSSSSSTTQGRRICEHASNRLEFVIDTRGGVECYVYRRAPHRCPERVRRHRPQEVRRRMLRTERTRAFIRLYRENVPSGHQVHSSGTGRGEDDKSVVVSLRPTQSCGLVDRRSAWPSPPHQSRQPILTRPEVAAACSAKSNGSDGVNLTHDGVLYTTLSHNISTFLF